MIAEALPEAEVDLLRAAMVAKPEYFDAGFVNGVYEDAGNRIFQGETSEGLVPLICEALTVRKPMSVVRIGDGETNILTFDAYPETPVVNSFVVDEILGIQQDSFKASDDWKRRLAGLMMDSIQTADVLGLVGVHRYQKVDVKEFCHLLDNNFRGICGQWRAVDYLLRLARQGLLTGKWLASPHLYIAVLNELPALLRCAARVLLITDKTSVAHKMTKRFPAVPVDFIKVGDAGSDLNSPEFFGAVEQSLPDQMPGTLALIGAGPWSEIYCQWVKERSGVAVDLGSGFDLLDGQLTRPAHQWNRDRSLAYALPEG